MPRRFSGARAVEQSKVRKRPDAEKQQIPYAPNVFWNTEFI